MVQTLKRWLNWARDIPLRMMLAKRRRLWNHTVRPLLDEYKLHILLRYRWPDLYYGWKHAPRREKTRTQERLEELGCPADEQTAYEIECAVMESIRLFFWRESW